MLCNLDGLKFSKEDHIQFIKLFYELILIQNLEATLISVFASVLVALLRKQHLISPGNQLRRSGTSDQDYDSMFMFIQLNWNCHGDLFTQ